METMNVKWEYKTLVLSFLASSHNDSYTLERLNEEGNYGWEVCAESAGIYLLKRIKQEE